MFDFEIQIKMYQPIQTIVNIQQNHTMFDIVVPMFKPIQDMISIKHNHSAECDNGNVRYHYHLAAMFAATSGHISSNYSNCRIY